MKYLIIIFIFVCGCIAQYIPGDFNGDNFVDSVDLELFSMQWQQPYSQGLIDMLKISCPNDIFTEGYLPADFDENSTVDFFDFESFALHWNDNNLPQSLEKPVDFTTQTGVELLDNNSTKQLSCCFFTTAYNYDSSATNEWVFVGDYGQGYIDIVNYYTQQGKGTCFSNVHTENNGLLGSIKWQVGTPAAQVVIKSSDFGTAAFDYQYLDLSLWNHASLRYYLYQPMAGITNDAVNFSLQFIDRSNNIGTAAFHAWGAGGLRKTNIEGWYEEHVDLSIAGKTCDLSNIKNIKLMLSKTSGIIVSALGDLEITLDRLQFYNTTTAPAIALTFDDDSNDLYDMASYLTGLGLKGTFYNIATQVGGTNSLTLNQLQAMQQNNHLIANHSYSHKGYIFNNLTVDQWIDEIYKCTKWMVDNGFVRGSRIYSAPRGEYPAGSLYNILGKYIDQIRLVSYEAGERDSRWTGSARWIYDPNRLYVGGVYALESQSTATQWSFNKALAYAIEHNTFQICYIHYWINDLQKAATKQFWDSVSRANQAGVIDVVDMADIAYGYTPKAARQTIISKTAAVSNGNNSLTGWTNLSFITRIAVTTTSANWSLTLYNTADCNTEPIVVAAGLNGSQIVYVFGKYTDSDSADSIHFNFDGVSGSSITFYGCIL